MMCSSRHQVDKQTPIFVFWPRRKISLPNDPSIFEELLRRWLAPPLEFHFVYATQKAGRQKMSTWCFSQAEIIRNQMSDFRQSLADCQVAFQVEDVKELKTPLKEKRHDLFQRPVSHVRQKQVV